MALSFLVKIEYFHLVFIEYVHLTLNTPCSFDIRGSQKLNLGFSYLFNFPHKY